MTIKNWPADQRPREKLLSHGASALSDAELLSLFVRTGYRGCSAIDVANAALIEVGSLSGLIGASRQRVVKLNGFGQAHHALLQAAIELGRRHVLCGVAERDVLALSLIDVRVLDHLIIGCGVQTSLAERGLM